MKIFLAVLLLGFMVLGGGCAGKTTPIKDPESKVEKKGVAPSREMKSSEKREPRAPVESTTVAIDSDSPSPAPQPQSGLLLKKESPKTQWPASKTSAPPPPLPSSPQGAKEEAKAEGQDQVVFNFDDADLYEVIKTLADLLTINYIVDPNVKGKVTIHTSGALSKEDLLSIFHQILDINGLAAVKEGTLFKIIPFKETPRMPIPSQMDLKREGLGPEERVVIQIIPLKFISAQEMTKLLTPFISAGGAVVSDTTTNALLVVDKSVNIMKVLRLVEAFDVDVFERINHQFYPLKYIEAKDAAKILKEIFAGYTTTGKEEVKFVAVERVNTLLAVSKIPGVLEKVQTIVREMDKMDKDEHPKIYVYFVRNGEAGNIADVLNDIFGTGAAERKKKTTTKDTKKKADMTSLSKNPFSTTRKTSEKETPKTTTTPESLSRTAREGASIREEGSGSAFLKGEVRITTDETRNALIIQAIPVDYRAIEEILRQLDVMPRQVLIEATIAEISLDSSTDLGINWAFGQGAALGMASWAATLGGGGLKYSIGVTDKWYAALNALASQNKVNVLSSPHVLASDNKEARIDVSREIPIASSNWTFTSGTEPVTQTDIQYRDTGVILSVTPHINDKGLVTMDINQEVSELSGNITVAGVEYPSFFKRIIVTTLAVGDGQTLAIGGLIKDKVTEGISGLPCLINVPGVRYLAGTWGKDVEKAELIILITPRVIVNLDDVEAVTEEFKGKVKGVVQHFNK